MLVDKGKILSLPLHIKLRLMENVFSPTNNHGKGFEYLREKFRNVSDAKLKEGIFIRPQIHEIIKGYLHEHLLTETEKSVWLTFKAVCLNFLGNLKAKNYKELVEDLLNAYSTMGCNLSLKINFLHSHWDIFPPNLSSVSDERRKNFRQDFSTMETRYAGKSSQNILADYCWNLIEEVSVTIYKRMSYRKTF